jgi:tetratricopeptide (TPR) repeat protein
MRIPDWRKLIFHEGVFPEPVPEDGRIVLWLTGECAGGFQYWERIGTAARAEVAAEQGICTTAATSIRARQRVGGLFSGLLQRFRKAPEDQVWTLPNGESAEQCGERQTDLVLAWAENGTGRLDEARARSCWPQGQRFQQLAENLLLVSGVEPPRAKNGTDQTPALGCPRAQGEQLLAAARAAGDRRAEATALTDLGIMALSEGDGQTTVARLQEALRIARELGDRSRESDVLGSLGQAALAAGQAEGAWQLFAHELTFAREVGDRFAEKLALERLGLTCSSLRDPQRALAFFEQALALARTVGDRQHEANLLWHMGVQYAELGQRDHAVTVAQAAIDLLKTMGKPEADVFANHLRSYRLSDAAGGSAGINGVRLAASPGSVFGGAIDAAALAGQPGPQPGQGQAASGPGLLRMALSAAKAMTQFLGSGFKTVPPETHQKRLQTCATCEHHTGLRCKVCGCFTNIKTRMPHEACPIGKWPS